MAMDLGAASQRLEHLIDGQKRWTLGAAIGRFGASSTRVRVQLDEGRDAHPDLACSSFVRGATSNADGSAEIAAASRASTVVSANESHCRWLF
jgi:hypothetical protein